jgi:hypothetical protein
VVRLLDGQDLMRQPAGAIRPRPEVTAMTKRSRSEDTGRTEVQNVAACMRTLNHTIGELARCYGAACVAAALTEVMGCATCTERVTRRRSAQALAERLTRGR